MTGTTTVIVGAGVAGLAAAMELQRLGQEFLLLEASHRIGGRAYTEDLAPGVPFDLGAHWVMAPGINPLTRLAGHDQLLVHEAGEHFSAARYFEDGVWLPEDSDQELGDFWDRQYEAMAHAARQDTDVSVFDVIDNDNRWAPYFHMFFAQDFTRDVDQASVKDTQAFLRDEEDLPVAGGLGYVVARYGADVPVTLNAAVRKIDSSGVRIRLETAKGEIEADNVIVTVSTGVLANRGIEFTPALPDWKLEAIQGLPLGSHTRTALMFDEPVLREFPRYFTVSTNGDGPIHFRNRPFDYDYVEVVTGGRLSEWMEKSGEPAIVDLIMAKLRDAFGSESVPDPVRRIISAWNGDEWTKGAYSCARPGAAGQRPILARPIDNRLFFAGEAASADAYASLHGACFSGREAARSAVASCSRSAIASG